MKELKLVFEELAYVKFTTDQTQPDSHPLLTGLLMKLEVTILEPPKSKMKKDDHPEYDSLPFLCLLRCLLYINIHATCKSQHIYMIRLTDGVSPLEKNTKLIRRTQQKKKVVKARGNEMNFHSENNIPFRVGEVAKGQGELRKQMSIKVGIGIYDEIILSLIVKKVKQYQIWFLSLDWRLALALLEVEQMELTQGERPSNVYTPLEDIPGMITRHGDNKRIAQLKRDLSKSFSMKDLGPTKQIIDIRIFYDRGAKKLHISCRFNMDKAKVVSSPLTANFKLTNKDCPSSKKNIEKMDRVSYTSAVGSLMYAMVCTRPDLAHAIGVVSRFLSNPGAVSCNRQSRLQKCVTLSTTEAEYMAAAEACKELLWLKRFLQELGFKQQRYAVLCDNQSAIHLAKNSMFQKRTKHIDIRYHWIRYVIKDGMFELNKVHTDDNASDMLTKAVA
ncbi:hypothetical protein Tco_0662274 [Tanacetum coccineum]